MTVARFTASLDAAMTLLGKGWVWRRLTGESMSVYRTCPSIKAEWSAAVKKIGDIPTLESDASEDEWEAWERRRVSAWKRFRKMLSIDPSAAPVGAWSSPDEDTSYTVATVPVRSAILGAAES